VKPNKNTITILFVLLLSVGLFFFGAGIFLGKKESGPISQNQNLTPTPFSQTQDLTATPTSQTGEKPLTPTPEILQISTSYPLPVATQTWDATPYPATVLTESVVPIDPAANLLFPELGPTWVEIPLTEQSGTIPVARMYLCPWLELDRHNPQYTYEVVKVYPHDPQAYIQGLIYRDGLLIEGTGLKGRSSLRKVDLESGEVLLQHNLEPFYFGEGVTELGVRIFQLTWKQQTGFIYAQDNFEQIGLFHYPTQGWGLTHDGQNLIMSDGSAWLSFLDLENQQVISSTAVLAGPWAVEELNELETIQEEVWANIYQTSCVARIDPQSGRVVGWIDLSGLLTPEEMVTAEVPNGIAYDEQNDRIFVTGKLWPKLFEIKILPKGTP
jgi:glutamine cyclotransferase